MPTLKQLTCQIEWSRSDVPLREYGTVYSDGFVQTFVTVPPISTPFSVHLTSKGYIAPGLAMFVYMDGVYQCNRNIYGLETPESTSDPTDCEIDFRVRQREQKLPNGSWYGKEWSFAKLSTESGVLTSLTTARPAAAEHLGTIEVVVLRCQRYGGWWSEAELQADKSARNQRVGPQAARQTSHHEHVTKGKGRMSHKRPLGSDTGPTLNRKPGTSIKPVDRPSSPGFGDLGGLFDGAGDDKGTWLGLSCGLDGNWDEPPWSRPPGQRREHWEVGTGVYHPSSANVPYASGGHRRTSSHSPTIPPARGSWADAETGHFGGSGGNRASDHESRSSRDGQHKVSPVAWDESGSPPDDNSYHQGSAVPKDSWQTPAWGGQSSGQSYRPTERQAKGEHKPGPTPTDSWDKKGKNRDDDWQTATKAGEQTWKGDEPTGNNDVNASWDAGDNMTKVDDAGTGAAAPSAWHHGLPHDSQSDAAPANTGMPSWDHGTGGEHGLGIRARGSTVGRTVPVAQGSVVHHLGPADAFVVKPYWTTWKDATMPVVPDKRKSAAERRSAGVYLAEEPPEDPRFSMKPENYGDGHGKSYHVRPGRAAHFANFQHRPVYMDTPENPYAVFVFKYRSKEEVEQLLDMKVVDDPEEEKRRLRGLSKDEIIEELLKAKVDPSTSSLTNASRFKLMPPWVQSTSTGGDAGAKSASSKAPGSVRDQSQAGGGIWTGSKAHAPKADKAEGSAGPGDWGAGNASTAGAW
ncbi:MAG: hypothetical protein M1838_000062 [Thelocarpon superellum]|nr:MAG: hypothetical protein M1838_000062 [Thelocarpon superellum]